MPAATSPSNPGNATTLGTLVHIIGLFFSFLGTGLVYLLSDNEVTKRNARNAFNWQVFFLVAFGAFAVITTLDTFYSVLIGIGGMVALFFVVNPALCVLATIKANRGVVWEYPLAPNLV